MTPEDFAARHPRLVRLSFADTLPGIRAHGLLPARDLAARGGLDLADTRRAARLPVRLPDGHRAWITDNRPLSERKLAGILDDDLTPADWMGILNERVFFWTNDRFGRTNLTARKRLGYESEWHVFDTLRLLSPVWDRAEISAINTGATVRQAPRRGRDTFAPLATLDYDAWRTRRREAGLIRWLDAVQEVTVRGGLPQAADALLDVAAA